jgi:radical SAM-linked protein
VRKTGFTIAPEAGSQRLRDVINKNISETEIFATVKDAFDLGWQVIKLYFMIGLPTETAEDLKALVDLVKALRKIKRPSRSRGQLNVSLATFIPKPHTPFQWAAQLALIESEDRIKRVQDQLKLSGIQFKWQNPKVSRLEGVWARGDRRLGRLLVAAYNKGCKFDGWSDHFRFDLWESAFEEEGVDPDFYTTRARDVCEPLPWDHINTQLTKTFLSDEWKNAQQGSYTADCRVDDCNQCGVCDFEQIEPRTHQALAGTIDQQRPSNVEKQATYKKLSVFYTKQDAAKYFGHLEMVNIFLRALKRADIEVKFSEGFHPKPKVSFDNPLPVGIESLKERFIVTVSDQIRPQAVMDGLNAHLPAGLVITHCQLAPNKTPATRPQLIRYQVELKEDLFDEARLNAFNNMSEAPIRLVSRKGKLKKIDLKAIVERSEFVNARQLKFTLKSEPGKTVRPFELLRHIFKLSEEQVKQATIIKLNSGI